MYGPTMRGVSLASTACKKKSKLRSNESAIAPTYCLSSTWFSSCSLPSRTGRRRRPSLGRTGRRRRPSLGRTGCGLWLRGGRGFSLRRRHWLAPLGLCACACVCVCVIEQKNIEKTLHQSLRLRPLTTYRQESMYRHNASTSCIPLRRVQVKNIMKRISCFSILHVHVVIVHVHVHVYTCKLGIIIHVIVP